MRLIHNTWIFLLALLLSYQVHAGMFLQFPMVKPFGKDVPNEVDFGSKNESNIPVNLEIGLVIVDVMINHKGPYRFIIDTGSDVSILSLDLVKQLDLKATSSKKRMFNTHQKKIEIETFHFDIDEVKLGVVTFRNASFIASNTATDEFQMLKNLKVEGILGENIFYDLIMTLNLPEKQLILHKPDTAELLDKGYVSMQKDIYVPIITAQIIKNNETTNQLFLVDTGYTGFVKMAECYVNTETPMSHDVQSHDIFNATENGFMSELDGVLQFGMIKLERPTVKYEMGACEKDKKWGLIGTRFLMFHKITIDQRHRYVTFH